MNELGPLTSAIVRVRNAQDTVAQVVSMLLASDLVDEVVCVDDRSTDGSLVVLRGFGRRIVLVEAGLRPYHGKGEALAEAVWRANGTIVFFVDAGLTTLSEDHIRALVAPLDSGDVRAVLGFSRGESPFANLVAKLTGARFTSERAYLRADLMRHLMRMAKAGSGVEMYLNGVVARDDVTVVPLAGLQHLGWLDRPPRLAAAREYVGAAVDVTAEMLRSTFGTSDGPGGPRSRATHHRSHRHGSP